MWVARDRLCQGMTSARVMCPRSSMATSGWLGTACQVFFGLNGEWVEASKGDRFDLMIAVALGAIDDVAQIAEQLRTWCA